MKLRIEHSWPQVGVNTQRAAIQLHTTQARIQMEREPAQLEIHSPRPKIHIDQSQCFADAGLRSPERFAAYRASEGQSGIMEAIERISSEGDQLAQIRGTSVADIALQRASHKHEFDVKAIPQQPPEIRFEIYPVQFNYRPEEITTSASRGEIQTDFQPGKVEIYEKQPASLEINWVGKNLNASV